MEKNAFTKIMASWLEQHLKAQYGAENNVKVLIPTSNISKVPDPDIKKHIPNYSSLDFAPDVLGILTNKKSPEKIELVFLNRSVSAISLKEIGEMQCYCRLANPAEAFIASTKGVPREIAVLLFDSNICHSLLSYHNNKSITLFTWDEAKNDIDQLSIYPIKTDNKP